MNIKKGDNVIVLTGTDKGKNGKVLKAFPRENAVLVEGINMRKKHQRPSKTNQKGQVVEKAFPIHVSNVKLASSGDAKPKKEVKAKKVKKS